MRKGQQETSGCLALVLSLAWVHREPARTLDSEPEYTNLLFLNSDTFHPALFISAVIPYSAAHPLAWVRVPQLGQDGLQGVYAFPISQWSIMSKESQRWKYLGVYNL